MKTNLLFIDDEAPILSAYRSIFGPKISKKMNDLKAKLAGKVEVATGTVEESPFVIYTAEQGQLGVDIVERKLKEGDPIQIAFVDMRMPPGINGLETAAKIHLIDPSIYVVFVTAYSDLTIERINSVFTRPDKLVYLKKPFDNEEIEQLARNLGARYWNEVDKEKQRMIIDHEIRTPVSIIIGFSEFLLQDNNLSAEQRDYLTRIHQNAKKILTYVG